MSDKLFSYLTEFCKLWGVGPAKVSPRLPYLVRTGKLGNAIILRQTNLHTL
jgi:hypothetical protein